jgi:hypothetical protein
MGEIAELIVPNVVVWAVIFAIFAWDERRMTDAERARAWPVASRRLAVVLFSPLCVPLHFWRTRRGLRGVALAAAWTLGLFGFFYALDAVLPE